MKKIWAISMLLALTWNPIVRAEGPKGLEASVIDETIKKHASELRGCYEKALADKKDLAGRAEMKFVVGGEGKVTLVSIANSTLQNEAMESCLVGTLQRIEFPKPVGGGTVDVTYPFEFSPAAKTKALVDKKKKKK